MRGLAIRAAALRPPRHAPVAGCIASASSSTSFNPKRIAVAGQHTGDAGLRRCFAAVAHHEAPSETELGLLRAIQGDGEQGEEGRVLSYAGGLVRIELPGPVAVGQVVRLGDNGAFGVVLRYDRRGAIAAVLSKQVPRSGAAVTLHGPLSLPPTETYSATGVGLSFTSVEELLGAAAEDAHNPVLRLPDIPPPHRRKPIQRHLPSGLAITDAVIPFGEGQRIGFVGPAGTGKSRAAAMLLAAQKPDTVCVFATESLTPELRSRLISQRAKGAAAPLVVMHASPHDAPGTRYLLPFCAIQLASQLRQKHKHVLLVLDDVVSFAAAADELGVVPFGAPHALAAALSAGGCARIGGSESALSVAVVLDLSPDDDIMTPTLRDLWRGAEDLLDIHVDFNAKLASLGVLPAVDPDHLLPSCGLSPPKYQAPFLKQLRGDLLSKLRQGRDMAYSVETKKQLGLHIEVDESEELANYEVARAILCSQPEPLQPPEFAVLLCAALVMQFQGALSRRPSRAAVAAFQRAAIATIRDMHPAVWNTLCVLEEISEEEAPGAIINLAEALLMHRFDFELTRPVL